ncbi:MAG TPA: hypothetical protein EYP17_06190 [Candidatus Latescibacteria bacterium]|nr:hypothetical protein [Candidatus Latescibacterota bacterium]
MRTIRLINFHQRMGHGVVLYENPLGGREDPPWSVPQFLLCRIEGSRINPPAPLGPWEYIVFRA